ncbi:Uncharacterised protein [Mycobacteroides abscessus subsp. abscessus]|nr:Uncharacterised protein [Mycobacteroides abscessus subsp. abscessus]
MLNTSMIKPWVSPSILSANRRAMSCASGIQVGFGSPVPCSVRSAPRLRNEVSELSSDCITSRITDFSEPR